MTSINREIVRQKIFQQSNLLPLLIWASLVTGITGTVLGMLNLLIGLYIGGKDVPSLVQLQDGQSALVEPVDSQFRSDELIKTFTQESMSQLFTWNTVNQDSNGSRRVNDPGVSVGTSNKVPTRAWQASFSLSNDFRETFMQEVAESFIPPGVLSGEAQSALLIESLSDPIQTKPGMWRVDMVSFLVIFDGQNPQGKATSFNKTLVIRAVEPSLDPLPEETTAIQKAVYRTRSKGLEIYEIFELGSDQ